MVGKKKRKPSKRSSRQRPRMACGRAGKGRTLRKKIVLIVVDGMADTPQIINGKEQTPLSSARKPNMDWLAERGAVGELSLLPVSQYPKSQTANISLLGYNPKDYYLQRGPLEAVGADLPYVEGHLAFRCNFATVDKSMIVVDRRAGRSTHGLNEIGRYINEQVKLPVGFVFMRTYGHRAVLILKDKLSDKISGNDPHEAGLPAKRIQPLEDSKAAKHSAEIAQQFVDSAHNVIEYHPKNAERIDHGLQPANYIILREPGNKLIAPPNFPRKWKFKRAVCIAENGVMKATCMLSGFNSVTVPELSPESTVDFVFDSIDTTLPEYDFVYAHIKAADEAAHDGNFELKRRMIEEIDAKLERFENFDGILILTCDHITSCETKKHMPGPVPVLIYGKKKDKVKTFDEFHAKKGSIKKISGRQLWKYVFGR
jgi:2,3-bisphosphoglycerate-independent phosphoglycerate mutase